MKKSKRVLGTGGAGAAAAGHLAEVDAPPLPHEVSVREAKDRLSTLLQLASEGEEIVITSDGEPKAMLVPHRPRAAGKPWVSLAAFRSTQPPQADSGRALAAARADRH